MMLEAAILCGLSCALLAASETAPIAKETVVHASRADVWQAWTTDAGASEWFSPATNIELRPGGPYEILFDLSAERGERGSEGCTVLSWVDEEMLSFTWNAPARFTAIRAQRTFVVVQLEATGESSTLVRLTHGGWRDGDDWAEVRAYFDQAWGGVLDNLVRRFAEGPLWEPAPIETPARRHYVYYVHPARSDFFETGPTAEEQATISEHAEYLGALLAKDVVLLAGPSFDPAIYPEAEGTRPLEMPAPGIIVFRAEDDEAARAIMEADPAVAAGLFMARANPFTLSFRTP